MWSENILKVKPPTMKMFTNDCNLTVHRPSLANRVDNAIDEALLLRMINTDTPAGLKVKNPNPGNLYCLPKIHKSPGDLRPPRWPICNSRNTPMEKISQWVDEQLQPLVKDLPSYVKDDNDFLRKIRDRCLRNRVVIFVMHKLTSNNLGNYLGNPYVKYLSTTK